MEEIKYVIDKNDDFGKSIPKSKIKFTDFHSKKELIEKILKRPLTGNETSYHIYNSLRGFSFITYYAKHSKDGSSFTMDIHNVLNKTYGKKNVPTLYTINDWSKILEDVIYCPHCKKIHKEIDYIGKVRINEDIKHMKIEVDKVTCLKCHTTYNIEDMKLIDGKFENICGDLYIDNDKITLSFKYLHNNLKKDGLFYYEDGYTRLTFNTKTGYTYTTNKGHAYKVTKKLWEEYENNKIPPYTFNSTYTFEDNTGSILNHIAYIKQIERLKGMDKEQILNEITNKHDYYKEKDVIYEQLLDKLITNLNEKVQSNFNYKIQKLTREHLTTGNSIRTLKNFNRYINLKPNERIMDVLMEKQYKFKKNKINREEINIINGLFSIEKTKLGKKTRALAQQEISNTTLLRSCQMILNFKNPDNINRLMKVFSKQNKVSERLRYSYYIDMYNICIKEWIKYRGENYVANSIIEEANEKDCRIKKNSKLQLMKDAYSIIYMIKENLVDFNINDLATFKNEKQFHDDIVRFYNSDEYNQMANKAAFEKVFKLEQDFLKLEDIDNNIYLGKNRGQLMQIGRRMHICVGGYCNMVEDGICRIAYIQDNEKEYKACLELRPIKEKNSIKYKLVQAKLKYNRMPSEDMLIYNKIIEWTKKNDIKIDTYDMKLYDLIQDKEEHDDIIEVQMDGEIEVIHAV